METDAPRAVLERAQRLFVEKDMAGFADMFAEDGTHELPFAPPGVPKYLRGRETIRDYLTSITSTPLEIIGFHAMSIHETGDPEVIIAEYEAHGIVVSTGKSYEMPYVQLLRARNGEIVIWRDYWSPLAGIQALGVRALLPTLLNTVRSHLRRRRRARVADGQRGTRHAVPG